MPYVKSVTIIFMSDRNAASSKRFLNACRHCGMSPKDFVDTKNLWARKFDMWLLASDE